MFTAGWWSRYLLWEKYDFLDAIRNIEKKFKIKINNYTDDTGKDNILKKFIKIIKL
jgi:hypothetical protein